MVLIVFNPWLEALRCIWMTFYWFHLHNFLHLCKFLETFLFNLLKLKYFGIGMFLICFGRVFYKFLLWPFIMIKSLFYNPALRLALSLSLPELQLRGIFIYKLFWTYFLTYFYQAYLGRPKYIVLGFKTSCFSIHLWWQILKAPPANPWT